MKKKTEINRHKLRASWELAVRWEGEKEVVLEKGRRRDGKGERENESRREASMWVSKRNICW